MIQNVTASVSYHTIGEGIPSYVSSMSFSFEDKVYVDDPWVSRSLSLSLTRGIPTGLLQWSSSRGTSGQVYFDPSDSGSILIPTLPATDESVYATLDGGALTGLSYNTLIHDFMSAQLTGVGYSWETPDGDFSAAISDDRVLSVTDTLGVEHELATDVELQIEVTSP